VGQPLLEPGQIIGQHRVEGLLGRGGIAEVYLVTELALEVQQALKVMVDDDAGWGRRMIREGRAQYLVQHPNLVRVHGSASIQGRPALIMEYVRGFDLRRWLKVLGQQGRWPSLDQALCLFQGVLAGVGAVHEHGLVHRDLKPANILVQVHEHGVTPKVTDFGLVKNLRTQDGPGEATVAGTIMGTQGYIAPEQIWALPSIDARADVFALGCILYLLVCREAAFGDKDTSVTFGRVLNEEYVDPRLHVGDLPEGVVLAIRYALVSDRRYRIPSCQGLWDVVERGRVALIEMGLLAPGQDPFQAAVDAPRAPSDGMEAPEITTSRRSLAEVRTVAMPKAMLQLQPDLDLETVETPQPAPEAPSEPRLVSVDQAPASMLLRPTVPEVEPPEDEAGAPASATPPSPPAAPKRPAPRRRALPLLQLAAGTVVVVGTLLLLVGGGLWWRLGPPRVSPSELEERLDLAPSVPVEELAAEELSAPVELDAGGPEPVTEPQPSRERPAPEPAPVVHLSPGPQPAPAPEPAPALAPAAPPEPVPEPPAAPPEPAPEPPAAPPEPAPEPPAAPPEPPTGRVIIEGTSQRVCLLGHADGREYCAARVPAGSYDVLLYASDEPVAAGVVEVRADRVTSLRCDPAFLTCH
jgi:serine/threonine protein kinase